MGLLAKERLIVALDVPTVDEAQGIVRELSGVVSFFKIGIELLMSGKMFEIVEQIGKNQVFLDLKLPSDIPTTVRRTVALCAQHKVVKFLTLSSAGPTNLILESLAAAVEGRGASTVPKLLTVPYLSSLDRVDYATVFGGASESFESFLVERSTALVGAGSDGLIVSGKEIELLRAKFPKGSGVDLVSPGIRPAGHRSDDHKRFTTPTEAIRFGADYLVVGRPICAPDSGTRKQAAEAIVAEIEAASADGKTARSSGRGDSTESFGALAAHSRSSE